MRQNDTLFDYFLDMKASLIQCVHSLLESNDSRAAQLKSFVSASAESAVSAKSLVVSVMISVALVVDVVDKVPTVWVITC